MKIRPQTLTLKIQQHQLEQNQSRRQWGRGKKTWAGKSSIKHPTALWNANSPSSRARLGGFPLSHPHFGWAQAGGTTGVGPLRAPGRSSRPASVCPAHGSLQPATAQNQDLQAAIWPQSTAHQQKHCSHMSESLTSSWQQPTYLRGLNFFKGLEENVWFFSEFPKQ